MGYLVSQVRLTALLLSHLYLINEVFDLRSLIRFVDCLLEAGCAYRSACCAYLCRRAFWNQPHYG
jgi:hypothetical protein